MSSMSQAYEVVEVNEHRKSMLVELRIETINYLKKALRGFRDEIVPGFLSPLTRDLNSASAVLSGADIREFPALSDVDFVSLNDPDPVDEEEEEVVEAA